MKKIISLYALASLLGACTSCDVQKKSTPSEDQKTSVGPNTSSTSERASQNDCPPDLICTMDYRVIGVKLTSEKNVIPDEYRVFLTDNPRIILRKADTKESVDRGGNLIIAEDANMSKVSKSGSKVTFVAYANGEQIIKEQYVIGHDCCHIKLMEGPKEIKY